VFLFLSSEWLVIGEGGVLLEASSIGQMILVLNNLEKINEHFFCNNQLIAQKLNIKYNKKIVCNFPGGPLLGVCLDRCSGAKLDSRGGGEY
jgi:hypothetical protein